MVLYWLENYTLLYIITLYLNPSKLDYPMNSTSKITMGRVAELRSIRKERYLVYVERKRSLLTSPLEPLMERIIRGEIRPDKSTSMMAKAVRDVKRKYDDKLAGVVCEVIAKYQGRIDAVLDVDVMTRGAVDSLYEAEHIFAERNLYPEELVEAAKKTLLATMERIDAANTPLSGSDLMMLSTLAGSAFRKQEEKRDTLREFVKETLDSLGQKYDDAMLDRIKGVVAGKECDLSTETGRLAAQNLVLTTVIQIIEEKKCAEATVEVAVPAQVAPVQAVPAPRQVQDFTLKNGQFRVPARIIARIMGAEGMSEEGVQNTITAIVSGFRLGGSKPAIGNVYFPMDAVLKNLRAVEGIRPEHTLKFLQTNKIIIIHPKVGKTASLSPKIEAMPPHWGELMQLLFRRHAEITNGH